VLFVWVVIDKKEDAFLFECSSSWDVANLVKARWANPKPICGCGVGDIGRHWCFGSIATFRRDILCRHAVAAAIECFVWDCSCVSCPFPMWPQCRLHGVSATLGEARQSMFGSSSLAAFKNLFSLYLLFRGLINPDTYRIYPDTLTRIEVRWSIWDIGQSDYFTSPDWSIIYLWSNSTILTKTTNSIRD